MEARRRTWFDAGRLIVDGTPLPLLAGAVAYWRMPPARWPAALAAIRKHGLTVVETHVPWRIHEPAPGQFDFRAARDLPRFLELALAAGLGVVLRLGPRAEPGMTCFGLPDHVVGDAACQARTARDTPVWLPSPPRAWPVPSYGSEAFTARLAAWWKAVAQVVDVHLAPEGAVVAVAIEDGRDRHFRGAAFDHDYHPDAIDGFGVDAPRAWDPADAPRAIEWIRHGERAPARHRATFERILDEVGFAGIARLADGLDATASDELMPWLPPTPAPPGRYRHDVLERLAAGAPHLRLGSEAPWIGALARTLVEVDWPTLRRAPLIALVATRADARFGLATNVLEPFAPALADLLQLGPGGIAELGTDAAAPVAARWHEAVRAALELAQVPYAIVDETASEDELARYRAVIVPTQERVDLALWQRLRALAESKRTIVVIGPGTPTRDELDRPLAEPAPRRLGRLRAGSLDDLPGLAEDLSGLAGELPTAWTIEGSTDLRVRSFVDTRGQVRVVFVANRAAQPVTAMLRVDATARALHDPLADERADVEGSGASVTVAARATRLFVVVAG